MTNPKNNKGFAGLKIDKIEDNTKDFATAERSKYLEEGKRNELTVARQVYESLGGLKKEEIGWVKTDNAFVPSVAVRESISVDRDQLKINGIEIDSADRLSKQNMAWIKNGGSFTPTLKPNCETLPPGYYEIKSTYTGELYMEKMGVNLDELFMLPDDKMEIIFNDLEKFWTRKEIYKEYGITYKRGVLMYGPPGTGKTSLINIIVNHLIKKYNGIVINLQNLYQYIPMVRIIRQLEPEAHIMAIIEDMDSFIYQNNTKDFLNVLDGNVQVDDVVYIASTNYIERMEPRIVNRPSRFDLRVEISYPSAEARRAYIENKLKPKDLERIPISKWVNDTDGFTIAHLKELIISVCILDNDYERTLAALRLMNEVK